MCLIALCVAFFFFLLSSSAAPPKKEVNMEDSVVEVVREQKCFSRLEVSSNEADAVR